MKITFYGAAQTVTGSCYLLETDSSKFIIDCGMFQGRDVEDRNYEPFDFDPSQVDFLILTHAHIDHSGLLPKLYRAGFRGKIFSSLPTAHLAELLLADAASIQENKNKYDDYGTRRFIRLAENYKKTPLLFDMGDALGTIGLFNPLEEDKEHKVNDKISIQFVNAGHILGAVSVIISVEDKKIMFSGDIGHRGQLLVNHFDINKKFDVDYAVMESLYGGQLHEKRNVIEKELIDIINSTLKRNGNVMIPSFALQRTQELLFRL